jgi:hypothetical protein
MLELSLGACYELPYYRSNDVFPPGKLTVAVGAGVL